MSPTRRNSVMNGRGGPTDDAAVVLRMAAGSEAALETLYDRYAPAIFAAAYRLTSDRGTAEEVVQETFLALWNRAESFDAAAGSLAAWLHRSPGTGPSIGCARPAAAVVRAVVGGGPGRGPHASPRTACPGRLGRRERRRPGRVRRRPSRRSGAARRSGRHSAMPDVERTVILLAYQQELSQSEIAERLGWPLGTVKTRTRRALLRLRDELGTEFGPAAGLDVVPVPAGEDR